MCAKKCFLTGKGVMFGKNVSHSNIHTNRKFKANLKVKKIYIPSAKTFVKVVISAAGLKTIDKCGI